jgi:hypothetical protein
MLDNSQVEATYKRQGGVFCQPYPISVFIRKVGARKDIVIIAWKGDTELCVKKPTTPAPLSALDADSLCNLDIIAEERPQEEILPIINDNMTV